MSQANTALQPRTWASEWRAAFGAHWRAELALLGALAGVFAALTPLSDPDLPIHLATGEWIARLGAVPRVEPFAWTRAGAPFQAYSWLPELLFYAALKFGGPAGLRGLHALFVVAAGAAVLVLGAAADWRPRVALAVATLNLVVAALVACCARPQILLFSLIPLAWAAAFRILRGGHVGRTVAALFAIAALAASSHLLFPLTGAPLVLLAARWRRGGPYGWGTVAAAALAVAAGWLASPYGLSWPDVFRLNFAPNALITYPSPLAEYAPGFGSAVALGVVPLAVVLALAALPWGLSRVAMPGRERALAAVYWAVGLVGFALAARALLVWWLLVLPWVGAAVEAADDALGGERPAARQGRIVALWALCSLLLLTRLAPIAAAEGAEGTVRTRTLPVPAAPWVDPLAAWLECHARPGATGRLYTVHSYGSYIIWRLPAYSPSIDGRTIFADSIAGAESYRGGWDPRPATYGPWAKADVAIVPAHFAAAAVLDTARGWRRAATAEWSGVRAGLWVRDGWWARAGRPGSLPARQAFVSGPGAVCAAASGATAGGVLFRP
ncbi:MAG: hypothetical protein ACJ79S_04205 [Gemmatimonadaceae bacterium]